MERSEELNWTDVRWEEARRLVAGGAEFEWIEAAGGQPYASLKTTTQQKNALYNEWATTEVMHEWLSKGIDEEYRQVLGILDFAFGWLRAAKYVGRPARVYGWYRRAPVPYLEVDRIEMLDGRRDNIRCYFRCGNVAMATLLILASALLFFVGR